MKILVTSGTWYPERNGVARVATEVSRKLAQRGHAVTAIVPRDPALPIEEREGSLVVRRLIERGRLPLTVKDVLETSRHGRAFDSFDVVLAHGPMTAVGISRARVPAPDRVPAAGDGRCGVTGHRAAGAAVHRCA